MANFAVVDFEVPPGRNVWLNMSAGARILRGWAHDDRLLLSALVDYEARIEQRRFTIVGCGLDSEFHADSVSHGLGNKNGRRFLPGLKSGVSAAGSL